MPMRGFSIERRLWERLDRSGECWVWTGATNPFGYGCCMFEGRSQPTHRIAWILTYGPIPSGLLVLHYCDNPPCCRPEHLFLGTHTDNSHDRELKQRGNHPSGVQHGNAKLSAVQVIQIRLSTEGREVLAERFGVCKSTIWNVQAHKTYTNVKEEGEE